MGNNKKIAECLFNIHYEKYKNNLIINKEYDISIDDIIYMYLLLHEYEINN